jgi:hypothetical protein
MPRLTKLALVLAAAAAVAGVALVASRQPVAATATAVAEPPSRRAAEAAPLEITVYRSPACGCCKAWATHLEQNGFTVKQVELDDLSEIKAQAGITQRLASCHTALIGRYAIEGHVPAADIKRLMAEKPDVAGLTTPGMPQGSPGMEGGRKDPFDVLAFTRDGKTTVWASH